jgi:CRP/FNR family cyclic AMP-dependent transcriptional regulator
LLVKWLPSILEDVEGEFAMVDGALLQEVDIFNGLTDQQLDTIAASCQEAQYSEGDIILHESEQSKEMYIIAEGEVEIMVGVSKGDRPQRTVDGEVLLVRLGVGQVFGEMAVVDQGLRSATVRCSASPTRLLIMQRDTFLALCDEDNNLGYTVMRNLAADVCFKLRSHNLTWK